MSKVNDILRGLGLKPHPSNWKHFWAGLLFSTFIFVFIRYELEFTLWHSFIYSSAGAALLLGAVKEVFDKWLHPLVLRGIKKGNFDVLDWIMTTLGGVSVSLALILIDLIV